MSGPQRGNREMSGLYRVGHDDFGDDRKFVMNLEPCGGGEWLLTTYRNTGSLPPVRQDRFASREEAAHLKRKSSPLLTAKKLSLGDFPRPEERLFCNHSPANPLLF